MFLLSQYPILRLKSSKVKREKDLSNQFSVSKFPKKNKNGLSNSIRYSIGDTNRRRIPPPQPVSLPATSSRSHFIPERPELLLHGELLL